MERESEDDDIFDGIDDSEDYGMNEGGSDEGEDSEEDDDGNDKESGDEGDDDNKDVVMEEFEKEY